MRKFTGLYILLLIILLTAGSVMGLFDLFGKSEKSNPDEQVLIELEKAGSDLSKPHDIELFLFFPTKEAANSAANQIKTKGFDVKVQAGAESESWVCYVYKTMVPELQAIQKTSAYLNEIADSLGGKYDGWGTEVVN